MARKKADIIRSSAAEYLTYVATVGDQPDSIELRYEDENVWLTQKMMGQLYDIDVRTVSDHLKKIYSDEELTQEATIRKYRIVQTEGSRQVEREVNHYNLQAIVAVGFKVNNERAVQFRKWANSIVKDYTIQGWVMDVERLNGFLVLWDHEVLKDAGRVSAEMAKLHAETEFEKYRIVQDRLYESDFDRFAALEEQADLVERDLDGDSGDDIRGGE